VLAVRVGAHDAVAGQPVVHPPDAGAQRVTLPAVHRHREHDGAQRPHRAEHSPAPPVAAVVDHHDRQPGDRGPQRVDERDEPRVGLVRRDHDGGPRGARPRVHGVLARGRGGHQAPSAT
jgi:hypothetical protein